MVKSMYIEEMIESLTKRVEELEARRPMPEEWLTVPEAAQRLHVTKGTIYRKISDGVIYASTKTGTVRVPISQFYDEKKPDPVVRMPKRKKHFVAIPGEPEWAEEVRQYVFGSDDDDGN